MTITPTLRELEEFYWMLPFGEPRERYRTLMAALAEAAPSPQKFDIEKRLHDVLTVHGIASYTMQGLVTDLVHWAADSCRQSIKAEAAPSGWQPIETAPERTPVFAACKDVIDEPLLRIAMKFEKGWQTVPGLYAVYPTHWRPLPPPPAQGA